MWVREVTARMKHKTELRKGLVRVRISGEAAFGAEITADGKPAGTLFTRSGDRAIAHVRHDRAEGEMRAGEAALHLDPPRGVTAARGGCPPPHPPRIFGPD